MSDAIFVGCLILSGISMANAIVWSLAVRWHGKLDPLNDPDEYLHRIRHQPWYVRYTIWFNRKILRKDVRVGP